MKNALKIYLRIFFESLLGQKPKDLKNVPIIINNFNRVITLKKLIEDLENRGYKDIRIIDNNSDYPPLLEYYKTTPHRVYRLNKNIGFKALWKSGLWYKFMFKYHCYTDSDINLVKECPDDFMQHFYNMLQKYPKVHKVGFSLRIDDLPDHYSLKHEVIAWESQFYDTEKEPNIYLAPIDTTFAMYRPFTKRGKRDGSDEMLRTGFPYQAHHMPWYVDTKNPDEDEIYYVKSIKKPTHWSKLE